MVRTKMSLRTPLPHLYSAFWPSLEARNYSTGTCKNLLRNDTSSMYNAEVLFLKSFWQNGRDPSRPLTVSEEKQCWEFVQSTFLSPEIIDILVPSASRSSLLTLFRQKYMGTGSDSVAPTLSDLVALSTRCETGSFCVLAFGWLPISRRARDGKYMRAYSVIPVP